MSASAGYSRARSDDTSSNAVRSNNTNFSISLNTQITPKTSGSAGVTYSMFRPTGTIGGSGSEAFTAYIGIRHSF
jgi:predicted porin